MYGGRRGSFSPFFPFFPFPFLVLPRMCNKKLDEDISGMKKGPVFFLPLPPSFFFSLPLPSISFPPFAPRGRRLWISEYRNVIDSTSLSFFSPFSFPFPSFSSFSYAFSARSPTLGGRQYRHARRRSHGSYSRYGLIPSSSFLLLSFSFFPLFFPRNFPPFPVMEYLSRGQIAKIRHGPHLPRSFFPFSPF